MLDAGKLDKRVTIEARSEASDGGGGATVSWSSVATVWASIAPGSGREFVQAQQENPELSHVVRMRYRTSVTAKHRLKYTGSGSTRYFPIHVVLSPDERHESLLLYCSEVKTS